MASLFGTSKRKRCRTADTEQDKNGDQQRQNQQQLTVRDPDEIYTFEDLGLAEPLVKKCKTLGFKRPTPVQRTVIPFLLRKDHFGTAHNEKSPPVVLALAKTGQGKTATFVLPILHRLAMDPYGIYAVIVTPTRELAKQIHQQVLALGSAYSVTSALVVGGLDPVAQSTQLDQRPHFCVATPGRLAELLRGPNPPRLKHLQFLVLDEADRLLSTNRNSGFERDVAELLLHCRGSNGNTKCQTLLFSATMTSSLKNIQELASGSSITKFVIRDESGQSLRIKKQKKAKKETIKSNQGDNHEFDDDGGDKLEEDEDDEAEALTPKIPEGLTQEYIFMPSRVRDAYLLTTIRKLLINGGRSEQENHRNHISKKSRYGLEDSNKRLSVDQENDSSLYNDLPKARLAIIFVSTCERAALVSCILEEVGVANVALHSLLSQGRRLAGLAKFKSEQVRVLVATDVASRGLDIPTVDLVVNSELPRNAINYNHRVGRTARAGRRGLAISLVSESDIELVHAAERLSGRPLQKCKAVTDDEAIKMLGPVTKAARLAKMKLADIGFDELVKKFKERKARERKERARIERALRKQQSAAASKARDETTIH